MTLRDNVILMSHYNEWMNAKVYEAAGRLSHADFIADRGAFFGSLCGTLNHIVVADTIWLKRFAGHPAAHIALEPVRKLAMPTALNQVLYKELAALADHRKMLDGVIKEWADALTEHDLEQVLHYANTKGTQFERPLAALLLHFFNHQTHHRGQATTLLYQMRQDVGVTDLAALLPKHTAA